MGARGAPRMPPMVFRQPFSKTAQRGAMAPFLKCSLCLPLAHTPYPSIPRCVLTGPVQPSCRSIVTMDGTNIGTFSPTSTAFSLFTTSPIVLSAGSHTLSFVGTGAAPDTSDFIDFVTLNNTSAQLPPSNTAPPTITGTPQVGQTLTGAHGSWTNAPTSFSDQWYRAGVPISGATSLTYSPQTADVGSTLTLGEIATNAAGSSAQAMSAATAPVTAPSPSVPVNISVPTITGTPQVGQTLTGAHGSWTNAPTSFSDQWYRAGAPISGATALTYSPQTADVGSTLTLGEIAANAAGSSAPAMSAATAPVTSPPATGIVNGSFEVPPIGAGRIVSRPAGATWVFTNDSGIQSNGSAFGAPNAVSGTQTAYLQCGTNPRCALSGGVEPTITETFTVGTAGPHTISFSAALRTSYNTAPTPMSFNVTIDGTVVGSFMPTSGSWTTYTTNAITLTSGNHVIAFVGTGQGPDTTDLIDNVVLN